MCNSELAGFIANPTIEPPREKLRQKFLARCVFESVMILWRITGVWEWEWNQVKFFQGSFFALARLDASITTSVTCPHNAGFDKTRGHDQLIYYYNFASLIQKLLTRNCLQLERLHNFGVLRKYYCLHSPIVTVDCCLNLFEMPRWRFMCYFLNSNFRSFLNRVSPIYSYGACSCPWLLHSKAQPWILKAENTRNRWWVSGMLANWHHEWPKRQHSGWPML